MKAFFVSKRLAFGSAIKTKTRVKTLEALGITIGRSLRFDVIDLEQMIEKAKVRPSGHKNGFVWPERSTKNGDLSQR